LPPLFLFAVSSCSCIGVWGRKNRGLVRRTRTTRDNIERDGDCVPSHMALFQACKTKTTVAVTLLNEFTQLTYLAMKKTAVSIETKHSCELLYLYQTMHSPLMKFIINIQQKQVWYWQSIRATCIEGRKPASDW
jgi:hypothetical protein